MFEFEYYDYFYNLVTSKKQSQIIIKDTGFGIECPSKNITLINEITSKLRELEFKKGHVDQLTLLRNNNQQNTSIVKNRSKLLEIAELLQVDISLLERVLISETCTETRFLNCEEAKEHALALGHYLLVKLVRYLIKSKHVIIVSGIDIYNLKQDFGFTKLICGDCLDIGTTSEFIRSIFECDDQGWENDCRVWRDVDVCDVMNGLLFSLNEFGSLYGSLVHCVSDGVSDPVGDDLDGLEADEAAGPTKETIKEPVEKDIIEQVVKKYNWSTVDLKVSENQVLISLKAWKEIEIDSGRWKPLPDFGVEPSPCNLKPLLKQTCLTKKPITKPLTKERKIWLCCTTALTFYIPTWCMSKCGMKRKDRQIAFKEKIALNLIILIINAVILFLILGVGKMICDSSGLTIQSVVEKRAVLVHGRYYHVGDVLQSHFEKGLIRDLVFGNDMGSLFPKGLGYCEKLNIQLESSFRHSITVLDHFKSGRVLWSVPAIQTRIDQGERLLILYNRVYNLTNTVFPSTLNQILSKGDVTREFDLYQQTNPQEWKDSFDCLNEMFYIGQIDERDALKCKMHGYILLGASVFLAFVIGLKFIAAVQFRKPKIREIQDRFVVCFMPCYTESRETLLNSIDAVAKAEYTDSKRVLFIVSDGNVIGGGNDQTSADYVLDILGLEKRDGPVFAYHALGHGMKQLNNAQVYHGVYKTEKSRIPFVFVVKVGSDGIRPGNRGKRDSQLILMQLLSRVYYNEAMCPLQVELYKSFEQLGISVEQFEYLFMVEADTVIDPKSMNQLVGHLEEHTSVGGVTGDVQLSNAKTNFITMIQVYDYFVSQHMVKAFESLFGSVTCLPSCFSLFRIKTKQGDALMIDKVLMREYSINQVDTLHLKNLLNLAEDRYLTTLIMKYFGKYKTSYEPSARADTIVPSTISILKTQRRRWINSTIHNLTELLGLDLIGACCCSMRIVVFLDLLATFTQPAVIVYIIYITTVTIVDENAAFPLLSVLMVASVFGLQTLLFLAKLKIENVGWMMAYFLAIPIFSFYLPAYAFWKFDDFIWGHVRTQVVNSKVIELDGECTEFDCSVIEKQCIENTGTKVEYRTEQPNHSSLTIVPSDGGHLSLARRKRDLFENDSSFSSDTRTTYSPTSSNAPRPLPVVEILETDTTMSELVLAPFDTDQVQRILEKCKDAICLNLTSNLASNQEEIMAIATEYLARLTTETTYQDIIDHVELVIPNLTEEQKSMLSQGIQALLQNLLQ